VLLKNIINTALALTLNKLKKKLKNKGTTGILTPIIRLHRYQSKPTLASRLAAAYKPVFINVHPPTMIIDNLKHNYEFMIINSWLI